MGVKTRIVRIGNSQGIRIPKRLLEQSELPEEVEILVKPGGLVVRAAQQPRAGWSQAARLMRERDEDRLLDEPSATEFDREAWQW